MSHVRVIALALCAAVVRTVDIDYDDVELRRYTCQYYHRSPPVTMTLQDPSSAWTRLLVILPALYTAHACVGETAAFPVCEGLEDVFFFAPTEVKRGVRCGAVEPEFDARLLARGVLKSKTPRALELGMFTYWSDEHVASTYALRAPPGRELTPS